MLKNERDELRDLDWSKGYAGTPGELDDAARVAFLRIRQRERRRRRTVRTLRRAACAAACVALVAGASLLLLREKRETLDSVVPLAPEALALGANDEVYASRADGYFHVKADCPKATSAGVALKLVTALEFEKELCPDCGAGYVVEP